ncbi:23S rRNA (pseudouridine(1915)-N(3))-methyltransferase RlmH [Alterisphingorhabdus coralli]|uniref:Ribosomal RNA large subunit methyltransferase H n=1 Tax=Alterisphingorhabdus coralli TaxID=3071408 RepID=A0AA97F6V6_9SPHN|nr:23S rRNA (pseudouridine(1915)-N(3))-methyltransferase RlmH [Parasphingorhabdus sp. SCSIO 66989]WOE75031.1 23S rRNA (pseudouridine(1915)-N(3))-methyltransferase RlmH [Parasphingorhabdus sp. SCSIO 66989]
MKLHIIARGKIGRSAEAELVTRYMERLSWPWQVTELPDRPDAVAKPPTTAPCRTILLDEKGKNLSSVAFSGILGRWRDDGVRETRLFIGGADGFDDAQRAEADLLLSFGNATWPHMMARAMLAEQLWRATSILAGHPYHREG